MRRFPTLSTWPEVENAFNAEFDRAFYEEVDVQAAIQAATANAKDAFDRATAESVDRRSRGKVRSPELV
jgi:hypothetical protein